MTVDPDMSFKSLGRKLAGAIPRSLTSTKWGLTWEEQGRGAADPLGERSKRRYKS